MRHPRSPLLLIDLRQFRHAPVVGDGQFGAVLQQSAVGIVDLVGCAALAEDGDVVVDVASDAGCDDGFIEGASQEVASHVEVDMVVVARQFLFGLQSFHVAGVLHGCATRDDHVNGQLLVT